jgi:3-hydroxybutyryl-CoA dehydrogenase
MIHPYNFNHAINSHIGMNIETIGIVGLGLLGRGIAACCLAHGFRVIGFTRSQATHDTARAHIDEAIRDLIERAGHPPELAQQWPARYQPVSDLEPFAGCDLVIETVVEDLEVKQKIYDKLEALLPAEVPIASNTSALPISQLQSGRQHPERLLGMHWSENAHATRFLELIRGEQTSDDVFERVARLATRLGKEPSLVQKDVAAFVCNRLGYAMFREAVHIVESGIADVETVDRACRNAFGLWSAMCGPFRWMDISGGPALYAKAMAGVLPTLDNSAELPETLQKMLDAGAGGSTDGNGFYSYEAGDREKWEERFRESVWHVKQFQDKYFPLEDE